MNVSSYAFLRKLAVLLLLFFVFISQCFAEFRGRNLLKRAVNHTLNATFKSEKKGEFSDVYLNEKVFYYADKGWLRWEYNAYQDRRMCYFISAPPPRYEEFFWVSAENKNVIHNFFLSTWIWHFIYQLGQYEFYSIAKYQIRPSSYNGIPCYLLTLRIPVNDHVMANLSPLFFEFSNIRHMFNDDCNIFSRKFSDSEFSQRKNDLKKILHAVIELTIDKNPDRSFIYKIECFNVDGKKTRIHEWGKVVFDSNLDPALFLPPKGRKVTAFSSKDEFSNFAYDTFGSGNLSRFEIWWFDFRYKTGKFFSECFVFISSVISRCGDFILVHGGKVAIVLVIFVVAIIAFLKVKEKRFFR